jgi:hypothetical protein
MSLFPKQIFNFNVILIKNPVSISFGRIKVRDKPKVALRRKSDAYFSSMV